MRLLALVALAMSCLAGTQSPNAPDLIRRSVGAIEADWKQAPNYSFIERDIVSKRKSVPAVETYEVLMIDGSPYKKLIAVDDKPLPAGEQAQEEQKLHQEIERRQHESARERARRVSKYQKEREHDHALLLDMVNAFDFQVVGSEIVNGHECWVLDASPKRGYQPADRNAKVLVGMRGRLWIDKSQDQWVRVKAQVFKPVTFFGFIAKVGPGTRFLLEQEPIAENLWLPTHFSVQVKAMAFGFFDEDSTDDETYHTYKPMPTATALLASH